MLAYKLIGAALIALSGGLTAYSLNKKASDAFLRAEALCRLLEYVKNEIACFSLPISQILSKADIELLAQCGYVGKNAPQGLMQLCESIRWSDRETKMLMERFCSEFGRCYKDEQVQRCAYFLSALERRKQTLEGELPSRKKLNSTLCVSGSLALLIFFL